MTDPGGGRLPAVVPREQADDFRSTLLWLFDVLWRRWPIVFLAALAGLGGGIYWVSQATPIFRSSSTIYVETNRPKLLEGPSGVEGGVAFGSNNFLQAQVALIDSSAVLSRAAERLKSRGDMATFGGSSNRVARLKGGLAASASQDGLIEVRFESPHSEETATVVNEVVEAYIRFQNENQQSTASEILNVLQKQKQRREKELDKALEALVQFKREHPEIAIENSEGQSIATQRLSRITDTLSESEMQMIEAEARLKAIERLPDDAPRSRILTLVDEVAQEQINPERKRIQDEIRHTQETLENLGPHTTDKHPTVSQLQERLKELRSRIPELKEEETQALTEAMRQRYLAAETRFEQLQERYKQLREEAMGVETARTQLMRLESERENARRRVRLLDERIRGMNVGQDNGGMDVTIVEPAMVPSKPVSPRKARIAGMGLFLGLLFGCGFVYLLEILDQRLRTVEDVRSSLQLPVLGSISAVSRKEGRKGHAQKVYRARKSPFAEGIRTIRTSIYFQLPEARCRSLMVSSPVAQEGKSTVVSNLAIAMAQAGHRTLIVDADLRKPVMHQLFNLHNKRGLSEVLGGACEAEEAIERAEIEGAQDVNETLPLDVLPSGEVPENPAELLNSEAFAQLLDRLAERYDNIVCDSPPVLPVADARLIGPACSGALLVLRAEVSSRKPAQSALEALAAVGTNMLGVLVNAVPKGPRGYGYHYGYYRYGHHYGYYGHSSDNGGNGKKAGQRPRDRSHAAASETESEGSGAV